MNGTDGINPDTGLPVLPDGQWWRVSERADHVLLSIVERVEVHQAPIVRRLFGGARAVERVMKSAKVRGDGMFQLTPPKYLTERDIRDTAGRMLRDAVEAKHRASLYGDYPPKRLGETK